MKRRLLVRRGATDPLVDVCRNRRSIINRSGNEVPFTAIHKRAKLQLAEGVRRGAVAQHDERRRKTMRATRFRRAVFQRRGAETQSVQRVGRVEHVERVEGVGSDSGGSVAPRRSKEE